MKSVTTLLLGCALFAAASTASAAGQPNAAHGRYLIKISGCNDCHTAGYSDAKGDLPDAQWLTGNMVGYQGAWGTSYAHNLRTHFQGLTEAQWLTEAKTAEMDPPMPWYSLRAMSDSDLKDVYAFIHGLGAAGTETPDTVPAGQDPNTQFVSLVPQGHITN